MRPKAYWPLQVSIYGCELGLLFEWMYDVTLSSRTFWWHYHHSRHMMGRCLRGRVLVIISKRQHNIMASVTGITYLIIERENTFAIHDRGLHWFGLTRQRRYVSISIGRGVVWRQPMLQIYEWIHNQPYNIQLTGHNLHKTSLYPNELSPSFTVISESPAWPTSIIPHGSRKRDGYPWITYPNSLHLHQLFKLSMIQHIQPWQNDEEYTATNEFPRSQSTQSDHTTTPLNISTIGCIRRKHLDHPELN